VVTSVLTTLAMILSQPAVQVKRPVPRLLTSRAFKRALSEKVTAKWRNVPLRKVLNGITSTWKVGLLLDRRIDPTQTITLAVEAMPLQDVIAEIARPASAQAVTEGNVVYIGPPKVATGLEKLVEKRASEWRAAAKSWPRARRRALIALPTLHWNDLDRPRDIVKSFAAKFRLTVTGLDKVPHDLWAGATIPACSVSQGLSLLLVQFDLTFRWKPDGSTIEIMPLPATKRR
jgi:hypothetical protein